MMDIREIDGLWCDDITFCPEKCTWNDCPRNKENIRDRTIPHSFSIEIPQDCPKKTKESVKEMTFALFNESDSGHPELSVRRDSANKIVIYTEKQLTDEQMQDLYWLTYGMMKTGKRMKDLLSP